VLHALGVAKQITQRELHNNSSDIVRQLDQGESFVVTRNGIPVGELSALRRHRFIAAEAAVTTFRGAPRVEFDRFRADLDRAASQETAPRG
jgi:antitoxin (DNA-binding transcriptional repressor) of toxin-antitoxin stability system